MTRLRELGFSHRIAHDQPQTPVVAPIPGLHASAEKRLACPPVRLLEEHAVILIEQFEQTAAHRSWGLKAAAIMANHIHLVVGVIGDPEPDTLLRDFKSYGSRALNRNWPTPASGTWWTASGSRRKLADEAALRAAIEYVQSQEHPLILRTYRALLLHIQINRRPVSQINAGNLVIRSVTVPRTLSGWYRQSVARTH